MVTMHYTYTEHTKPTYIHAGSLQDMKLKELLVFSAGLRFFFIAQIPSPSKWDRVNFIEICRMTTPFGVAFVDDRT